MSPRCCDNSLRSNANKSLQTDCPKQGLEIYYSDTDSLVLNGSLLSEYLDSAKLGLLN